MLLFVECFRRFPFGFAAVAELLFVVMVVVAAAAHSVWFYFITVPADYLLFCVYVPPVHI